jgi:hypothetical protein
MSEGSTVPARALISLLAHIFGPSFYDSPIFGDGDPVHLVTTGLLGRRFDSVALNPQPLPPRERHALMLADAHIQGLMALDRLGGIMGGEVAERALDRSLRLVAEIDELCPRWPRWPKVWPPPPPPPWEREEMGPTELVLFGARFLAAADLVEDGRLRESLVALGQKAIGFAQG